MIFIGDTHSLRPVFELIDKNQWEGKNLIHVGDFGLGFNEIHRDVNNLLLLDEALIDTNNHLYVIRGNHDNPIFWDRRVGLNLPKFYNLHLVDDYSIINIEDKNVLFVGGAISIDRMIRKDEKPYPTWWENERFIFRESRLKESIRNTNMSSTGNKVDVVVTHTAPDFAYPTNDNVKIVNGWAEIEKLHGCDLKGELKIERKDVSRLYNELVSGYKQDISHWFYGHFHSSKEGYVANTTFKLLNVNEFYEV